MGQLCPTKERPRSKDSSSSTRKREHFEENSVSLARAMQRAIPRIHTVVATPGLKSFSLNAPRIVISGRRHVGIMSTEPVGNYGVRIVFDDLHRTGIYSWDYFYNLGTNKFTLMRNYIKTLKKHGLSRDPPKRK
ncbi:Gamma-butyrobetaine hydroxylase-like [Theobroma cacao]|nr:Gamma-butyrobetaine hydroxylase-like [Theobroma cacao]